MEEESPNASKRRKIEETVVEILKKSDLETATESSVRAAAAERLGFDLSALEHKGLVCKAIESFLLSTATAVVNSSSSDTVGNTKSITNITREDTQDVTTSLEEQLIRGSKVSKNGRVICQLSEGRNVKVYNFSGAPMVSIWEYSMEDGMPRRGINLTTKQWSTFRSSFPSIQGAIANMESRIRSEAVVKQNNPEVTTPGADLAPEELPAVEGNQFVAAISDPSNPAHLSMKRKQAEVDASRSNSTSNSQEQIPTKSKEAEADTSIPVPAFVSQEESVNAFLPPRLMPVQIARLDGKNYYCWRHQMEFFLKQLNIAYVLTEARPRINLRPDASFEESIGVKIAAQRWIDDDYFCRHSILNSLCDNLFQQYSQKTYNAKDLWEELRLAYDEDFGTKRSQINKYIQFQIVDGIPILEQVEELNKIINSITAAGVWIDENFHVSVIISKLPPSWKDYRARLMHEEFLPLNMLMQRLESEEQSRNQYKKERRAPTLESKFEEGVGLKKKDNKKLCYICRKEGHISKFCPHRRVEASQKSNDKENTNPPPQ